MIALSPDPTDSVIAGKHPGEGGAEQVCEQQNPHVQEYAASFGTKLFINLKSIKKTLMPQLMGCAAVLLACLLLLKSTTTCSKESQVIDLLGNDMELESFSGRNSRQSLGNTPPFWR